MHGLVRADRAFEHDISGETKPTSRRQLIEAVVSERCPLIGQTLRDSRFRTHYQAAVVAIARGDERVSGKLGDVVLRSGDTLLLEADEDFVSRQRNSRDFFLVSGVGRDHTIRHDRAWISLTIMALMIAMVTIVGFDLLSASLVAATGMLVFRCVDLARARQSVDGPLLVAIAGSLGLGKAIETSGLALMASQSLVGMAGESPWMLLAVTYVLTMLLTELVTNNAAAVLMFPIAMETTRRLGIDSTGFMVAICIAASAGFATPFGYQTNLMVYGPGGYRFSDYLKVGIPLDLIFLVVSLVLIPIVWPLR